MGSERSRKTPYDSSLYFLLILLSWFCNPFYHPRSFFDALRTGYHIRKNDAMRKIVFSDNIIMSMTFQKAKSCPHPAEKQKWYHNPQKTKASLCFRKHKKGSLQPRSVSTPDRGNPFISGFSSLSLCFSRHQNYSLDVCIFVQTILL